MKLITYLTFAGNCEEALNFYKDVLGGEIVHLSYMGDGQMEVPEAVKGKVMHSRLRIGDYFLYMSDNFDPSAIIKGNNVSLTLELDKVEELEKLFNELSVNGKVVMSPQDTFWGARFGMFVDKFGINWMLNCELKKEPSLN
jgi:PhnB protein